MEFFTSEKFSGLIFKNLMIEVSNPNLILKEKIELTKKNNVSSPLSKGPNSRAIITLTDRPKTA